MTATLRSPIDSLPSVGPSTQRRLNKLGVRTIADLLFLFPRRYEELTQLVAVQDLKAGELVSVRGTIDDLAEELRYVAIVVRDETGYLRCVWFNQPYMRGKFRHGQDVVVSGKPRRNQFSWEMVHPKYNLQDADASNLEILPIYPLTEGVNQRQMRQLVKAALVVGLQEIEEVMPRSLREQHNLLGIRQSLQGIHFPASIDDRDAAVRRFSFQELLVLQLGLAIRRHLIAQDAAAIPLEMTAKIEARIRRLLPFELTDCQNKAIQQIAVDVADEIPMNRLLQGDVGTGKTAVAVFTMLLAVAHGKQSILMAPTEVLAQQHFDSLSKLLVGSRVRLALWTGSLRGKQRAELLAQIAQRDIDIVIGTHAVVGSEMELDEVAVVVIDEQHRFGVQMRARLRAAGQQPHYLVMTATPIPRTMAMVEFGDLEVSSLRSYPPAHQTTNTYWVSEEKRESFWEFFRQQLRNGRQGFVIAPLVGGASTEDESVTSVESSLEALAADTLEEFRVGWVHGQMKSDEKTAAMQLFQRGETQVLVATSLVEVGIDVPNATVMVIENAERFGLAQLHQLRGRVGRGKFPGYVGAFAEPTTDEGRQRIEAFVATTDGFELAERDFALRGPGDLFGTRQHGLPPMRIADLRSDESLLQQARETAQQIVADDPMLQSDSWSALRDQVRRRYGSVLGLGDVG